MGIPIGNELGYNRLMTSETDECTAVPADEAKERLYELLSRVADRRERIVIERDGKPAAALVPVDDAVDKVEKGGDSAGTKGHSGLVGAWGDILSDEEIDSMVADIYAARERDVPRPVNLDG